MDSDGALDRMLVRRLRANQRRRRLIATITGWYSASFLDKQPRHTSILSGALWVEEIMNGNPFRTLNTFRMNVELFKKLAFELETQAGLEHTRNVGTAKPSPFSG